MHPAIRVARSKLFGLAAVLATTAGCGAANVLGSSDETPGEEPRPSPRGAFASGVNVSRIDGLESAYESQSAAAVLGERAFIAYRAEDPALTSSTRGAAGETQRVCWGASQLAVSVGHPASGFERMRIATPPGMALLWGPVAVARFRDRVIASALASPDERFSELAAADGCLTLRTDPTGGPPASLPASGALTSACLVPLTGGSASCVGKSGAVLEGGSLAATDGQVYAAYRDATHGEVVLFRSATGDAFTEVPVPATRTDGAVRLAASGSRLFLVSPLGSELHLLRYDEGLRAWEPPLVVTRRANRRHVPARALRPELKTASFTLALLEGEPGELAIFWQRGLSSGRTSLQGALCETARGGSCRSPRHLRVPKSRDNFAPSIASVARRTAGGVEYRHVLSYWRDTRTESGHVGLHYAEFDARGVRSRWGTLETQPPCALLEPSGGDWGASDASFVLGQGGESPVVYRAFTDSSLGVCEARAYGATPQHVSVIRLPAFRAELSPSR